MWPPPERGTPAYRILAAPAHIHAQGHCSIICRIWQELIGSLSHGCAVPAPPEGEPRLYLSLRGAQRRGNTYPALSVSCADSSPTGGAKLGLSGPHRPLPPPLGEVPPQGAERVSPAKKKIPRRGIGD